MGEVLLENIEICTADSDIVLSRCETVDCESLNNRTVFMRDMARMRALSIKPVSVTKETIRARLMELAQTDPRETRGSLDGQVKALRALADINGLTKDDPLCDKTDDELMQMVMNAAEKIGKKDPPVQ